MNNFKCDIEFIYFVIQVSPVKKISSGKGFIPLRKITLQQVSFKDIGMVHGKVEMGKRKRQRD